MTTDPKPVEPTGDPNVDALIDVLVCPTCRTIWNAAKAKCSDLWHYDNRPVFCDNDSTPHSRTDECVNPWPAKWTPGAGVELLKREHSHLVPEVSEEDQAVADRIIASLPAEPGEPDDLPEEAPESCCLPAEHRRGCCGAWSAHDGCEDDQNPRKPEDCPECGACAACVAECAAYRRVDVVGRERAAYDRGLAEGRRRATEGWEREWALKRSGSLGFYGFRNEAVARQAADRNPELALLARLVGPWEPEAACSCPMTDVTQVGDDGGEGIRTFVQGYDPACPACAVPRPAPASGGVVEPSGPLTAEHTCQGSCVVPGLAELLDTDEEIEAAAARTARLPESPDAARGGIVPFAVLASAAMTPGALIEEPDLYGDPFAAQRLVDAEDPGDRLAAEQGEGGTR